MKLIKNLYGHTLNSAEEGITYKRKIIFNNIVYYRDKDNVIIKRMYQTKYDSFGELIDNRYYL